MPFPMVHLCIAHEIVITTPTIKNPAEFLLGSMAPDAVHFRQGFVHEMKKRTHVCDEEWGNATDNEGWTENVLQLLRDNLNTHSDFVCGYCCHIFADIQNNIKFWIPSKELYREELSRGISPMHKQDHLIDYQLYQTYPGREQIWRLLDEAQALEIPGVSVKSELEEMKNSILYKQFKDERAPADSAAVAKRFEFIQNEAVFIKNILEGQGVWD